MLRQILDIIRSMTVFRCTYETSIDKFNHNMNKDCSTMNKKQRLLLPQGQSELVFPQITTSHLTGE